MENLQVIKHPEFGQLSVIEINGKEFFKAKECAIMLGYKDTVNAIKQHCKGVVKRHLPTTSGNQIVSLISEGDLWRLIIRSKLPQAEQIERWIMDEVLPSIRKTGSYTITNSESEVKKSVTYPVPNAMIEVMRCYDKLPEKQKTVVLAKIKEAEKLSKTIEPYEYAVKYYCNGKSDLACVTIEDIVGLTGLHRATVNNALHKLCRYGVDYLLLEGEELVEFKKRNPSISANCHLKLNIIFKSGFDILMKFFNKVLSGEQVNPEQANDKKRALCENLARRIVGLFGQNSEPVKAIEDKKMIAPKPEKATTNEFIISLNVLLWIKEHYSSLADEDKNNNKTLMLDSYSKTIEACKHMTKEIGMFIAMN